MPAIYQFEAGTVSPNSHIVAIDKYGNRFKIYFGADGKGIVVNKVSDTGSDQIIVRPSVSNEIKIF
jgi:hypothetical protein